MCGITGFLDSFQRLDADGLSKATDAMTDRLAHRGPDARGTWGDPAAGVSLGHRRLSILDLSPLGAQPMRSSDGRYVITFNGEIYNHAELRDELRAKGHSFRGGSDTEVMLAAFCQWGPEAVVRFSGMFAYALWDTRERQLHLGRDRSGEKPLYYAQFDGYFAFASEVRALEAHPRFKAELNRDNLALMMRYNSVCPPYSIYRNVRMLQPGTRLVVANHGANLFPEPVRYWDFGKLVDDGERRPFKGDPRPVADELERLLKLVVRQQMVSDVPLGAFLSGGVDSSTVVALMQAQSGRAVRTFTIGFREDAFNEAEHARAVARHLGTEHTELYLTGEQALEVIPKMAEIYDEPFADSSQIPTFLVSRLARQSVTVALSGDGGDEVFAGYNRYLWAPYIWSRIRLVPAPLRALVARTLSQLSPRGWERISGLLRVFFSEAMSQSLPLDKVAKFVAVLSSRDPADMYRRLASQWSQPARLVLGAHEPATLASMPERWHPSRELVSRLQYVDTLTYLPGDILTKVDRAAMAVSLEVRVPFLDHRVMEFAARIPENMRIRDRTGKWILRQVLYRHVPRELIERPKAGFSVPIGEWLRGPLRPWAEALLDERRLRAQGIFDAEMVRCRWQEHQAGRHNWQHKLWNVLMFQSWLERRPFVRH